MTVQKYHTLYVKGMHCKACTIFIKDIVGKIDGIESLQVHFKEGKIDITLYDTRDESNEALIERISPLLEPHGYSLSSEKVAEPYNWNDLILALLITIALFYAFITVQKLGLIDFISSPGDSRSYMTSFIIGLIASISSCLAVVGGLVLGLGTVYKDASSFLPHSLFHIGRLAGFFILGGVLGAVGGEFQISPTFATGLSMVVAIVIFILGLNLLGVIRGGVTLGEGVFRIFTRGKGGIVAPTILGIGTFFLPCGFTQSMQLYTLTTGSFWAGGSTMLVYALGTFPVLFFLSISGKSIKKSEDLSSLFFKTIGIILILFALFNITTALIALGLIPPLI